MGIESMLERLSDPSLIFILLAVGGMMLALEFASSGGYVAGIFGLFLMALAFVGLFMVPFNWIALTAVLLGLGFMIVDLHGAGDGYFVAFGGLMFVGGGYFLFGATETPSGGVSLIVLGGVAGYLVVTCGLILYFSRKARRIYHPSRATRLVGAFGSVNSDLDPTGTVQMDDELWSATSESGQTIAAGDRVVVTEVDGLVLTVQRWEDGDD